MRDEGLNAAAIRMRFVWATFHSHWDYVSEYERASAQVVLLYRFLDLTKTLGSLKLLMNDKPLSLKVCFKSFELRPAWRLQERASNMITLSASLVRERKHFWQCAQIVNMQAQDVMTNLDSSHMCRSALQCTALLYNSQKTSTRLTVLCNWSDMQMTAYKSLINIGQQKSWA